ncbi:phage integrase SAM-like domain-containing protein [Kordia sp.]|uniref:phage integrase SAM-like domain-containing protein n=1 Tax=Kordia sp. TaxID=1965332 RepID=UPI0025BC4400|nr:phage integrase SAM-like domain-containing protein [Kordia sp.]MCH2197005.1 phage integrase SAM-like domain-containing protein [Kordia sp.]
MYFNLKEPKGDKDTLIILRYFISKTEGRFVFSTGLTIYPGDWDKNTKMARATRGRSDLSSINRKLQEYVNFLDKTLSYFDLNKIVPSKENLKSKFLEHFKPEATSSKFIYFTDFVDDFTDKAPELTNRNTKKKYNLTKIKHYKKTNNRIKEYEEFSKKRIRIDKFTLSVYDSLIDYLKNNRGYAVNTVGDLIKNTKVFLNKAEEFGYEVHPDFKKSNFTVLKEESIYIALNEQ